MRRVDAISIDMDLPCARCGQMGAGGRAQLCLECAGKVVEEKPRKRKEKPAREASLVGGGLFAGSVPVPAPEDTEATEDTEGD